jgi:predicted metal-binding membrane protein
MTSTTSGEPVRAFVGVSALLFAGSASLTVFWCSSMSAMGEMPMPGGWSMTMTWMRMPGQTWPGAAASFLGMWIVMMLAMMLPSLIPMLLRYRQVVGEETRTGLQMVLAGAGYFFVWALVGIAAYPLGAAFTAIEMRQPTLARAVPIAIGAVVLIAGAFQFSAWKLRHLTCCREMSGCDGTLPAAKAAWRCGLRLGVHCCYCCAGLMLLLLVVGLMDLRVMALLTAAITIERLAPRRVNVARAIGAILLAIGFVLIVKTL